MRRLPQISSSSAARYVSAAFRTQPLPGYRVDSQDKPGKCTEPLTIGRSPALLLPHPRLRGAYNA